MSTGQYGYPVDIPCRADDELLLRASHKIEHLRYELERVKEEKANSKEAPQ